jgi:hypothetical protein
MCQRRDARQVQGGNQQPGGDADRLRRVVVLDDLARRGDAVRLHEHRDEPRRHVEEGLPRIGAERRQRIQPRLRRAMRVELPFFLLGRVTKAMTQGHVVPADGHEVPRLLVRAARSRPRGAYGLLDDHARDGPWGEVPDGTTLAHAIPERSSAGLAVLDSLEYQGDGLHLESPLDIIFRATSGTA